MDYNFEEGDIVIYKKDNSFYKILEVVKTKIVITYSISNDEKILHLVPAKDLELPS